MVVVVSVFPGLYSFWYSLLIYYLWTLHVSFFFFVKEKRDIKETLKSKFNLKIDQGKKADYLTTITQNY